MRHLFPYLLFYLFRISYMLITFFPLPQLHLDASLAAYLPNSMSFLSLETKQNKTTKFNLHLYWPTTPGHWACHIILLIYLMLLHCMKLISSKEVSIANSRSGLRLYIHFPFSHCLCFLCVEPLQILCVLSQFLWNLCIITIVTIVFGWCYFLKIFPLPPTHIDL